MSENFLKGLAEVEISGTARLLIFTVVLVTINLFATIMVLAYLTEPITGGEAVGSFLSYTFVLLGVYFIFTRAPAVARWYIRRQKAGDRDG